MSKLLTDEQEEKLIIQLADGQKEFSEDDALKVLQWATNTVTDMALLNMALSGKLVLSVRNGELCFEKTKPFNLTA